jgi:hypothetical protein
MPASVRVEVPKRINGEREPVEIEAGYHKVILAV